MSASMSTSVRGGQAGPRTQRCSHQQGHAFAVRQISTSRRHLSACRASSNDGGGFAADVMKIAKKIQGSLPIIGLVSRLAAPEGGFDELAYPEFCRSVFDKAPPAMGIAMQDLEKRHGKMATSRWVFLMLWMVNTGLGLVPPKDIIAAARRLRVSQDVEFEIDRFNGTRESTKKKYSMMTLPTAKPQERATVAVDALCTLCLGLKDGVAPSPEDSNALLDIIPGALPDITRDMVQAVLTERTQRAMAYT